MKFIRYAEITPQIISGNTEYNDTFFKQLDVLENNILDGQSFNEATKTNNLNSVEIKNVDKNKKDENGKIIKNLPDVLFEKIYQIKNESVPAVFKLDNKFYLAEIVSTKKLSRTLEDPVFEMINAQLVFKNKIKQH